MDGTLPATRVRQVTLVAAAIALTLSVGCSSFQGTTARSFLRKVREDSDPNARYHAYQKLASPNCYDTDEQKTEAVKTLVSKLDKGHEPVATRAVICRTLGELRDGAAREALIRAVGDNEGVVRAQSCRALGKVALPEDATILARVMTLDQLEDCRIAAIEGLGAMKSTDPRILQVLIEGMEHDDPAYRYACLEALRTITGEEHGVEPAPWRKALAAKLVAPVPAASAPIVTPPPVAAAPPRTYPPVPPPVR
jgi:hypothetical protein